MGLFFKFIMIISLFLSFHNQDNKSKDSLFHSSLNQPNVSRLFYALENEQEDIFLNRYSTLYFSHLNDKFPLNSNGTCAYTSLSMLLSFYDNYWNDSVVDEYFENNSYFSSYDISDEDIELPPLDADSPGLLSEQYNELAHINDYFEDFVLPNNYTYLQEHLIYLASQIFGSNFFNNSEGYGLTLSNEAELLSYYLVNERRIYSSIASVVTFESADSDFNENIINFILNGQPVLLNINSSIVGNHTVIAYDYNEETGEIYVHSGWKDENSISLYHVSLDQLYTNYIHSALAISVQYPHGNHAEHYISSSGVSYCACSYYLYGEANIVSLIYRDMPPTISFDSIYKEGWENSFTLNYTIYYKDYYNQIIGQEEVLDTLHTIDSHIWDYICRDSYFEPDYTIEIYQNYVSGPISFTSRILDVIQLNQPNDYYETASIKSTDYGYPSNYINYKFTERFAISHNSNGLTFQTTRFRAVNNRDGFVTLSCCGNGYNKSFIEYTFDTFVSFINIQMCIPFLPILSTYRFSYQIEVTNTNTNETKQLTDVSLTPFTLGSYSLINPKWVELSLGGLYNKMRISGTATGDVNSPVDKGLLYIGDMALWNTLPLSGSELEYNQNLWSSNYNIRISNNCYTYALNYLYNGEDTISPGEISGYHFDRRTNLEYSKDHFETLVKRDGNSLNFDFLRIGKYERCKTGYYKVALFFGNTSDEVQDSNSNEIKKDYHWYRQNEDGTWSHKLGYLNVSNLDADGNIIYDPEFCNNNYLGSNNGAADYDVLIGFYQIKIEY